MKIKIAAIAAIIAISVGAVASKKSPTPSWPKPTVPTWPTFPTKPTIPTIPTIPVPGPTDGPEVPFPMDATLPFPWGNIEGIWKVEVEGAQLYFSFNVQTDYKGTQYLHLLQINRSTGLILAEGYGLSIENDKLVRAAMTSKVDGSGSYMLFIGSYRNTPQVTVRGQLSKSITVLTVRSFANLMGDKDVQVVVTKVSNTPYSVQKSLPKPGIAY